MSVFRREGNIPTQKHNKQIKTLIYLYECINARDVFFYFKECKRGMPENEPTVSVGTAVLLAGTRQCNPKLGKRSQLCLTDLLLSFEFMQV